MKWPLSVLEVRFLADEDLDPSIPRSLLAREPTIDILDVKAAGLRGAADPVLLEIASRQDRIVITYDRQTMTRHFIDRLHRGLPTSGLFIVPQQEDMIGEVLESLMLVWAASQAAEWRDRIVYVPFR